MRGISDPQLGASQRTVLAHKYAIGCAPSFSSGNSPRSFFSASLSILFARFLIFGGGNVSGNVLQHSLEDQAGNGIQITGKRIAADP